MAITAAKLRRCEVWSTWVAAGGVRQAIINDAVVLTATSNIDGSDNLNLSLPLLSPAAAFVVPGAVLRVEEADAVFDEWIIVDGPNDDDGSGLRSVQGLPIRAAMARCELVRRIDSDGVSVLDFESVGLTPAQHIAQWVIPALTRGGMAWVVAGVITPTKLLDLTFQSDTPLSVLQRIADQSEGELDIQRNGTAGYTVNIIAEIGSTAPTADLRFDRNLQPGTQRNRSSLDSATRVFPIGADEDGRRATMSRASWQVVSTAGPVIALADPAGGAGPIQFDGQLAGLNGTTQAYFREPNGTLRQVIGSNAAAQTVTLASSPITLGVGDLIQFRADAAGSDLLWLDSPPDRLAYGLTVGIAEMSDVPSTNNLLKNSAMRSWPGSTSSPPPNWTKVGAGTVARQAASPFTRFGGFSIHRVTVADGDGLISDAIPIAPTATDRYVSGYGGLWVVSGQVRVELVFTTAGGPVVQPILPDVASNSFVGQWEDLGLSGIDAFALGATAVALRVVQHGATVADFYLDYGQATQSGVQLPFAESSGGTRLWQAANEKLRTSGAPLVSYDVKIVDLANIDPATWGADCKVVVGGKVRVTDPRLTIAVVTRVVELRRDYLQSGATAITLSNRTDDLTGDSSRPPPPPRIEPVVSPSAQPPAQPVLTASFDLSGQLLINSVGDPTTKSHKIAWGTGVAPSAATVRAAAAINQQNVTNLATGSTYAPATVVFVAAYAYDASGMESSPLAIISVNREGIDLDSLGRQKRNKPWDDSGYGATATTSDGLTLHTGALESGLKLINRLFAKPLSSSPDTADSVGAGSSFRIPLIGASDSSGNIDLGGAAWVNKDATKLPKTPTNPTPIATITGFIADTGHAGASMQESGGKAINRLFAKSLLSSPDTQDSVGTGIVNRELPLTVLTANNDLNARKVVGTGSTPGIALGAAAGTGGAAGATISGTDTAGKITFTQGASGFGTGQKVIVTFAVAYATAPFVLLTHDNSTSTTVYAFGPTSITTTGFVISSPTGGLAGDQHTFWYHVLA